MNDNGNGAGLKIPPPGEERREWIRYRLRKLKGPKGKRLTSADIARTTGAGESTVSLVFLGRRVDGDKAASVREHTAKLLEIPEATLFPEILTINAAHAVACPKCGHEFDPDGSGPTTRSPRTPSRGREISRKSRRSSRISTRKRSAKSGRSRMRTRDRRSLTASRRSRSTRAARIRSTTTTHARRRTRAAGARERARSRERTAKRVRRARATAKCRRRRRTP
jgi:hypothetical protein